MKSKTKILSALLILTLALFSCAELQQILLQQSASNLEQCKFRLVNIQNFNLAGISLGKISSLSQLSFKDGLQLTRSFAAGNLPTSFTLNLGVENPNTGSQGLAKAAGTLSAFPWSLYIDDQPTVQGHTTKPFALPTDQETVIPLDMNLNLGEFFKNQGYKNVMNLALAMGGLNGSTSRLKLRAKPTIDTPLGPIQYPNEIDILEKQIGSQSVSSK